MPTGTTAVCAACSGASTGAGESLRIVDRPHDSNIRIGYPISKISEGNMIQKNNGVPDMIIGGMMSIITL